MNVRRPTAHGISVARSEQLVAALRRAVAELRPRAVVETGTYLGLGTTKLLLEALGETPIEAFYTIEVSPAFYSEAVLNLLHHPRVHCLWGLSVGQDQAAEFIRGDDLLRDIENHPDLYIDSDQPVQAYLDEVRGAGGTQRPLEIIPERWLEKLLPRIRDARPLIALDSAGGIGWLEYQEVRRLLGQAPCGLFLDDINHVKHHRSFRALQDDPRARIVAQDAERGWAVALLNLAEGSQATWS